jgi:NAD(P)-dependent dehydrogenase (short-subunit alcohol dehydrogenase family)
VLISNAGSGPEATVEESSMDDLRRQFDVNVHGTVAVIKAVLLALGVFRTDWAGGSMVRAPRTIPD